MSLFRKRSMKPNQMQTIRRLEEEVDIGKVAAVRDLPQLLHEVNISPTWYRCHVCGRFCSVETVLLSWKV